MNRFPHSRVTPPPARILRLAFLAQHPAQRGTCQPLRRGTQRSLKRTPTWPGGCHLAKADQNRSTKQR